MRESLAAMLRRFRYGAGLSQTRLARQSGCDPAYVNRLENGSLATPSRKVVLAFARTLDLTSAQIDRLLHAAGLATEEDWQTRATNAEATLVAVRLAVMEAESEPDFVRRAS